VSGKLRWYVPDAKAPEGTAVHDAASTADVLPDAAADLLDPRLRHS
jgi:hypothetical protein